MAVTQTPRFALPQWSSGTDSYPGRSGFNDILALLEDKAAIVFPSGLLSNRPISGSFGRFYLATDQGTDGRLYYDGGSGWIELNTNGGGGPPQAILIDGVPSEGNSNRSARADHTHIMPLATPTNHGAMSSQAAELIESTSVSANPDALVQRTSSGNIYVPLNPPADGSAASRWYVWEITSDLRAATASVVNGTILKRTSSGHVYLPQSGWGAHDAITKAYVDSKTWSGSDITSGYIPAARVRYSQWAYTQAWGGSGSVRTVHVTNGYELCFYSSTERHKTNIKPWGVDPRDVFAVEPVEFDRLDPETGEPTGVHDYGVRAEQAGKHLPMYLEHDDKGQVEGWSYFRWTGALQVGLRDLDRRDHEKDQTIAGLMRDNEALSKRIKHLEDHLGV